MLWRYSNGSSVVPFSLSLSLSLAFLFSLSLSLDGHHKGRETYPVREGERERKKERGNAPPGCHQGTTRHHSGITRAPPRHLQDSTRAPPPGERERERERARQPGDHRHPASQAPSHPGSQTSSPFPGGDALGMSWGEPWVFWECPERPGNALGMP